jgi:hypothetical protein
MKKVNLSCNRLWRPIGLWDVEAPTFSKQSAHRWRWGRHIYASADLYPQERFLVFISVRGWVDARTTVRLEALGLNQLRYRVPLKVTINIQTILVNTDIKHKCYVLGHYPQLCLYLKHRPDYCSNSNISETGFCLRLQVRPTHCLLGPIDRDSPYLRTPVPVPRWGT